MLEHQDDVVLAGGLLLENEFCPVYVRFDTGDVVYEEESTAVMLIEGLTELDPMELPRADSIELALRSGEYGPGVIGVVYTRKHLLAITSESTAQRRPLYAMNVPTAENFRIDLNVVDPTYED